VAHLATQIRDKVIVAVTGLVTTGPRVFAGRVHAVERADIPCVAVDIGDEDAEYVSMGYPRDISATLAVEITAMVSIRGDFDAELNKIQSEVQAAMSADPTFTGLVVDIMYRRRMRIADGQGDSPIAALVLSYDIIYRYTETNPEV
jgi:hypothetical protein